MKSVTIQVKVSPKSFEGRKRIEVTGGLLEWKEYLPFRFCVHKAPRQADGKSRGWNVTEITTGLAVSRNKDTKKEVLITASENLKNIGKASLAKSVIDQLSTQELFMWGFEEESFRKMEKDDRTTRPFRAEVSEEKSE